MNDTRPSATAIAALVGFVVLLILLAIFRPEWMYIFALGALVGNAISQRANTPGDRSGWTPPQRMPPAGGFQPPYPLPPSVRPHDRPTPEQIEAAGQRAMKEMSEAFPEPVVKHTDIPK